MPQRARKTKHKLNYPEETNGGRLAAEIRRRCNKLTPEERRSHFEQGMAIIYGGEYAAQEIGPGHKPRARSR